MIIFNPLFFVFIVSLLTYMETSGREIQSDQEWSYGAIISWVLCRAPPFILRFFSIYTKIMEVNEWIKSLAK